MNCRMKEGPSRAPARLLLCNSESASAVVFKLFTRVSRRTLLSPGS
jgi:hypothetical protein